MTIQGGAAREAACTHRSAPCGQLVIVPSSVTGKPLAYFTPLGATELAACFTPQPIVHTDRRRAAPWLLLRVFAAMESGGAAALYAQAMAGTLPAHSRAELVSIASRIDPANNALRAQISFAGGKTPSTATHIYAPPSELGRLVDDLAAFLRSPALHEDPVQRAVVAMLAAVKAHPFVDGNGRWSRLLAIVAAQGAGDPWAGMAPGLLTKKQWSNDLADLEAFSRHGIAAFTQRVRVFSDSLYAACRAQGLVDAIDAVAAWLDAHVVSRKQRVALMSRLAGDGRLSVATLRAVLECSEKKAAGLVDRLAAASAPWSDRGPSECRLERLFDQASACVDGVPRRITDGSGS